DMSEYIHRTAVGGEPMLYSSTSLHMLCDRRYEERGRYACTLEHEVSGRVADGSGRPVDDAEIGLPDHELMGRIHFTVGHGRESRPIAVVVEPLIPPAAQLRCHLELGDDSIDVLTLALPHLGGGELGDA